MIRKILRNHAKRVLKTIQKEMKVSSKEIKREFEDFKYKPTLWNRLALLLNKPQFMRQGGSKCLRKN